MLLYFPPDMFACADELCGALKKQFHLKKLGIIITDSMILPLRAGVIAGAVAYAGFNGVQDNRGKPDLFGRKLQTTLVNAADALATAASFCMGEAGERQPLAVIEGASVKFVDEVPSNEIKYPVENDLYTPLFKAAGYDKKGEEK